MFVVEGAELLRSALEAGAEVESVYVAPDGLADGGVADVVTRAGDGGARVFDLAPGVLERVADTVTPQPVVAVLPLLDVALATLDGEGLVVVCVDVRDPGNAGTVLRSADAAGARAVVLCASSVDLYNPKTVRASAGSIFHIPVMVAPDTAAALEHLGVLGYRRLATVVTGGQDYLEVDWHRPSAIVLGNEASGLPPELLGQVDGRIGIPMAGRAESLNVGVACAVVCFEALARRRTATAGRTSTMPGMPERVVGS